MGFVNRPLLLMLAMASSGPATAVPEIDLSSVEIEASYSERADGLWEYTYTVVNPETSPSAVRSLLVDISCDQSDYGDVLPSESRNPLYDRFPHLEASVERLRNGPHVPVEVVGGSARNQGVTANNEVTWSIYTEPGTTNGGLKLIAPTEPGWRRYTLTPVPVYSGEEDMTGHGDAEDEELLDVVGMIEGPGCPGSIEPVEDAKPVFSGTAIYPTHKENEVLTYVDPQRSRWSTSEKQFAMTIRYSDHLEPNTFRVAPARLKSYFSPAPGQEETVVIPLQPGVNHIRLSAETTEQPEEQRTFALATLDEDEFIVRRDVADPKGKAHAYGKEKERNQD